MKLLTIAIPTYNRSNYLEKLLARFGLLVKESRIAKDDIEILVSDNSSTDNTKEICDEFKVRFDGIFSYHKNQQNLGASINFEKAIKRAKGKYVWLFGDDDIPNSNCLTELVEVLDANADIIYLSYNEYDMVYKEQSRFKNYSDYIKSAAKINPHLVLATTFITTCVFKKTLFDFEIAKKYRDTLYGHSYAIIQNKNSSVLLDPRKFFKLNINKPPFAEDIESLLPVAHHRFLLEVSFRYKSTRILFFAYKKLLNQKRREFKFYTKRFFKILFRL